MSTPHKTKKLKNLPWAWCPGCGLVYLRNALTQWCVQNGCDYEEHPGYKAAVRRLGGSSA